MVNVKLIFVSNQREGNKTINKSQCEMLRFYSQMIYRE